VNRKELEAKVADIYFEEHKSMCRRWLKDNWKYFKRYNCLPPEAERKCIKITGYSSLDFYNKAKGEAHD